ncbi:MAG: SRPBCC family protein [Actinobacteria bacterium]|nr:SRPBCC family protein [Actinomycetota bacterium]
MATIRHHARIDRAPDDVWRVVADAGAISEWFPAIEQSSSDGGVRDCTLVNGAKLREEIVTSDDDLRRFQYRIVDGDMPLEFHLGTVDVIADGDGSLVVYSTDLLPDDAKQQMDGVIAEGLSSLKRHLEASR